MCERLYVRTFMCVYVDVCVWCIDPIGYCEVYLADMNITASIATAVDSPLQGVAHGRVQLEVRLRDAPDTPGSESSTLGGSLQVEAEVDPKLEKGGDTSAELALACADTEEEEEERRATTSVGALQQDRVSPDAESGLDSEVNGDATSELDVISPQPYTATAHPPMQEFAPKPKQERRPSYLSTAENDDAMMSMIRALQDELEDWKLKYADMKASRDVLLQVSVRFKWTEHTCVASSIFAFLSCIFFCNMDIL